MSDKTFVGYLRCERSRRIRGFGHDDSFEAGKVYKFDDRAYFERMQAAQVQVGSGMVDLFSEAGEDDYVESLAPKEGRPHWPLMQAPADYLRRHGENAKWSERARAVVEFDEEHGFDEDATEGEVADETDEEETDGAPEWPLASDPQEYLDKYGEDAKHAEAAKAVIAYRERQDGEGGKDEE